MFNTQGMNFKDMCLLKQENIHEERLVYIRRKTKRIYNLKLTEQAKSIISYYIKRLESFPNINQFIFPILPDNFGANASADYKMYNSALK